MNSEYDQGLPQEATFQTGLASELAAIAGDQESLATPDQLESLLEDSLSPGGLTKGLIAAADRQDPKLAAFEETMRSRRRPGSEYRGGSDPVVPTYDRVVVNLLDAGRPDIAGPLISSSVREEANLAHAAQFAFPDDPQRAEAITAKVGELTAINRERLTATLTERGASPEVTQRILEGSTDPDAATAVTPEQWAKLSALPAWVQAGLGTSAGPVPELASAVITLADHELLEESPSLLPNVLKAGSPEAAAAYLTSLQAARIAVSELEAKGKKFDTGNVLRALPTFADPSAALAAAEQFYPGEHEQLNLFEMASLAKKSSIDDNLVEIDGPLFQGLAQAKSVMTELGYPSSLVEQAAHYLRGSDDPVEDAGQLTDSLRAAAAALGPDSKEIYQVLSASDRAHMAGALNLLAPYLSTHAADRGPVVRELALSQDVLSVAEKLAHAAPVMAERGYSFTDISPLEASRTGSIEQLCSDTAVTRELEEFYNEAHERIQSNPERTDYIPAAERYPEMKQRIAARGATDEQVRELILSWSQRDAVKMYLYETNLKADSITPAQQKSLTKNQVEMIKKELDSLETFATKFGNEELQESLTTFKIRNFARYDASSLHRQNLEWQGGRTAPDNLIISARADWNRALSTAGQDAQKQFPDATNWMFEANSGTDLAQTLVEVGRHERARGRTPDIKNLVINAHANPNVLALGTEGQRIYVRDYLNAAAGRDRLSQDRPDGSKRPAPRVQDYRRHIGEHARIILHACATAGENPGLGNIAGAISEAHDIDVDATPFITRGSYIVNPDNSVTFEIYDATPESQAGSTNRTSAEGPQQASAVRYSRSSQA